MSFANQIVETFGLMFKSLAGPGNIMRVLLEVGNEPWATLIVSWVFLLPVALLAVVEWFLRVKTGRSHVLVPDYVMTLEPDFGINTWAFLVFWGVLQGPLSAVV